MCGVVGGERQSKWLGMFCLLCLLRLLFRSHLGTPLTSSYWMESQCVGEDGLIVHGVLSFFRF